MKNPTMVHKVGGAIAGGVLGAGLIAGAPLVVRRLYPPPGGAKLEDMEAVSTYIQGLPTQTLGGVLFAYFLAATMGGLTAAKLSGGARSAIYATMVLLLATSTLNQMTIRHPSWFNIATPLIFIAATAVTIQLNNRRRTPQ